MSASQLFVPELAPDWQRGALRRAAAVGQKPLGAPAGPQPESVELWSLPAAADFGADPVLSDTVCCIEELRACGAADDLISRCAAGRASRRRRPGGRNRRRGSFELLFLAFVDMGQVSRTRFAQKFLTDDLLRACGFDFWPTPDLVDQRFADLESDWLSFRAVKNVFVRAAVHAEPRIGDIVSIDGTLLRSAAHLEVVHL